MIRGKLNQIWKDQPGFGNLSAGAQQIALHADNNNGSIAGVFENNSELLGSLDEFHNWSAVTVAQIAGKKVSTKSAH